MPAHAGRSVDVPIPQVSGSARLFVLPDRRRTPGETFPGVTAEEVCEPGWADAHRSVSEAERRAAFAAAGVPYADRAAYELDHLIPLELGGDNSPRNLWPEPGASPNPKDVLEDTLHDLVCSGRLSLGTAQRAIAANWITAYRRYVGPVP